MRPDPPFYVGRTRPTSVGWTRIGVTLLCGAVLAVLMAQRSSTPVVLLVVVLFLALSLWTWMGQATRFIVDEHGITVSLGGFLPRRPWPVENFRTVQLREMPSSTVGVTLGGYGWRRGKAITSRPEELTPVGRRKIFTVAGTQQPYRMLVTRPGTLVEIIGRDAPHYILSPEDPQATAEAVDQAIRARR
ncbi:hypothetical protein ACT3SP_06145 [Brachybacterium sp. AOP43-C2-M15]|uniref:hypothetical protein n=1 Tax=Brachybacterium sp. AOP43-C2-M15 TaxID=3457661 RepID=UPI004034CA09